MSAKSPVHHAELAALRDLLLVVNGPSRELDIRIANVLLAWDHPWVYVDGSYQAGCRTIPGSRREVVTISEYTRSPSAACDLALVVNPKGFFKAVEWATRYAGGLKLYLRDDHEYPAILSRCICLFLVKDALENPRG
ncbi:hypothetical protein BAJUN_01230 [Bajunvirus bajun]|uniref:Uncharacterized protein n=1 Tax=Brevundimonas phage vB_BgoS-Bajun TaxID=2948594 RepID=A0A9E7N4J2_9CAUD|nr:hypothetical protein BAJUN_01230 [Brevundimonas phage vB_BgoS-Bajun]